MFVDTHAHINSRDCKNIDEVVASAKKNNVLKVVNCADDLNTSYEVVSLNKRYNLLYPAVGIHPLNVDSIDTNTFFELEKIIRNDKVIAIGEIGLDYYYSKDNMLKQIEIFELQLKLASKYNLPVIIHSRNATDDMLKILKNYKLKGVIHCFSGSIEMAREFIKLGYFLGIGGVLTFKNSKLGEVIKNIPMEYILLETDSPFLTPEPYRKKVNEPKYIPVIAEKVAFYKNISVDEVMSITSLNASALFDFSSK